MVQHYELMVVFPGTMNESALTEAKQQVITAVSEHGTVTVQCDVPRRKLAYPIGQQMFGFYTVMQFDLDTAQLATLNSNLKLNQNVLRYLIVKAEPQTADQLQAGLLVTTVAESAQPVAEPAVPTEVELHSPAPATEPVTPPVEKKVGPVSLEELDKKLDAILEDSDIEKKL